MNILITGGLGFIGINSVIRFIEKGNTVVVFDNLTKDGSFDNLESIKFNKNFKLVSFVKGDVSIWNDVEQVFLNHGKFDVVLHLAAQTAVTTSVVNPVQDFESNAVGTFYVLEAVRRYSPDAHVIYSSTNKVYGALENIELEEIDTRYSFKDKKITGVDENEQLDFYSPYGCSKGAADQYVNDYSRIYNLNTTVVRQSCIAKDGLVLTPFGKKKIQNLKVGDTICTGYNTTRIKNIWKVGKRAVRKITTHDGNSIILTSDHKMKRPCGMVENSEFMFGDMLASVPSFKFVPCWEEVTDIVLQKQEYINSVMEITDDKRCINKAETIVEKLLPLTGDTLLTVAEIVGRMFGDGNLSVYKRINRSKLSYFVQHYGSEEELNSLKKCMSNIGLESSEIIKSFSKSELNDGRVIEGSSFRIQQQSIPIFILFKLLGVPIGDKVRSNYSVPDWVINGHKLIKRAFLRGFFGAELFQPLPKGYVCPSFNQSKDVDYIDSGMVFMNQLRELILTFGIETSITLLEPVKYKKGITQQISVRLLGGSECYEKLASIGYAFCNKRSNRLNLCLKHNLSRLSNKRYKEVESKFKYTGDMYWDSVETIEEIDEYMDVYDLEVEDDEHSFIAGGFQVSNCIYGKFQNGTEDQGWVAWFTKAFINNIPITIYGNGKQVRDVLYISDLVNLYGLIIDKKAYGVYNVGGGIDNTTSLIELIYVLENKFNKKINIGFSKIRPGDQLIFVSDNSKAEKLGWSPVIDLDKGLNGLINYLYNEG